MESTIVEVNSKKRKAGETIGATIISLAFGLTLGAGIIIIGILLTITIIGAIIGIPMILFGLGLMIVSPFGGMGFIFSKKAICPYCGFKNHILFHKALTCNSCHKRLLIKEGIVSVVE